MENNLKDLTIMQIANLIIKFYLAVVLVHVVLVIFAGMVFVVASVIAGMMS